MRNWILAAVIGLATCGQAWAWDDDHDEEPILYGGRYRSMGEWREAKEAQRQYESDMRARQMNESQMLFNQQESLDNQKKMLKIEERRLELEEERSRRDRWRD